MKQAYRVGNSLKVKIVLVNTDWNSIANGTYYENYSTLGLPINNVRVDSPGVIVNTSNGTDSVQCLGNSIGDVDKIIVTKTGQSLNGHPVIAFETSIV